jgi:hypothetical protein
MPLATGNVTTAAAAVYTSSGNTAVTFLSICNYSAGNVIANVFVVPNGSSAGNLTAVLTEIELASKDTYQLYAGNEKLVLGNGDSVQANANVDNAVTTVTSYYQA